jgi:hypothetical protein
VLNIRCHFIATHQTHFGQCVLELLKKIEMNMVEEWVVTLEFNKENLWNYLAPLNQQS